MTAPQTITLPVVWESDGDAYNLRVGSIGRIGRVRRSSIRRWVAWAGPTGSIPGRFPTLDAAKDAVLQALGALG